jgi:hypothetical protein
MPPFQLQLKMFRLAQITILYLSKINSTDTEDGSVSGLQGSGEKTYSMITILESGTLERYQKLSSSEWNVLP